VEAEGVCYLTAAGNDASNGCQAAWTPISGTYDQIALTDAESFAGNLVQTIRLGATNLYSVPLLLEWNQPYGAATSDLEILAFKNGRLWATVTNSFNGEPSNPWVQLNLTAGATYQIAIENLSGPDPGIIKEIVAGDGLPVTISGSNVGTICCRQAPSLGAPDLPESTRIKRAGRINCVEPTTQNHYSVGRGSSPCSAGVRHCRMRTLFHQLWWKRSAVDRCEFCRDYEAVKRIDLSG
jgi:hypothetical protein